MALSNNGINMQIFNTLTKKKEEFIPIHKGHLNMYVCGQTVYDFCHMGHARKEIVFDMIRRWFIASGYKVKYVVNITDIEDKIIDVDDKTRHDMHESIKKAFEEEQSEKAISEFIRKKMEERDPGKWNVILGRDFGSHVVHLSKRYGYFKLGEQNILIWKSG